MKRQTILRVSLLLLIVVLVGLMSPRGNNNRDEGTNEYLKASVVSLTLDTNSETQQRTLKAKLTLEKTGKYIDTTQVLNFNSQEVLKGIKVGDKVVVIKNTAGNTINYNIIDYQRTDVLFIVGVAVVALLLFIGRKNGVKTLLTLGISGYVLFSYLVPSLALLKPYTVPLLVSCLLISVSSFLILDGFRPKGLISIIATLIGVVLSMILSAILLKVFNLSGLVSEEYTALYAMNQDTPFNIKGLFFCAIIIGSLGAIMDVAMSLTSSLEEIVHHNPDVTNKQLLKSGLRIGNDTLSTMSATLLLAYISSALPMTILLTQYQYPMTYILNSSWFTAEIVQAVVGVMTLLFIVPLTTLLYLLAHRLLKKKTNDVRVQPID